MKYFDSYDEKIMEYDGNSYNEFMAMFEAEEVEEMRRSLERNNGYDYSYLCEKEVPEAVIADYVRERLIDNVREMRDDGMNNALYNAVFNLL